MSRRVVSFLLVVFAFFPCISALAQRQMERLGRGVVAVRTSSTQAYIGWRMLGDDPQDMGFNLYRIANGATNKLNTLPITNSCNFVDSTANLTQANVYFVRPVIGGAEQTASVAYTLTPNAPVQQYISIPLTSPPGGTSPATADGDDAGGPYTYNANDCSVGDVDGDGEYEIILKWDPTNSKDNSQSGFTGPTYLDCYKLDGTRLWRINLGPNIRSGAHYMDFMVFDFDGDGKAEVMCRTAPGSIDGLGNYVGGAAKWQNAGGTRPSFNDTDDYHNTGPNGANGYVLAGPEFLSVFNGQTGEEMATTTYTPHRDPDNNDDYPTSSRINTIWGDGYGNRLDRFLAGVAYLDGKRPSAIFCRGYYTRAFLVAWDWRNGQLTRRWIFDSNSGPTSNLDYRGQGAHSLTIGDVDGDGKDEIVYGACSIDDNGQGLYSTLLGHGDAEHLSDMDPNRPGLEIWMVHESPGSYGPTGEEFRDAKTGALIFGLDGQNSDVGRGVAIDVDPRYPGYEMWASRPNSPTIWMNATGVAVPTSRPSSMNFASWWDADLLREILDGTTISKWNWTSGTTSSLLSPSGLASNNGTKSTPCLSADILGDWREEVVWRTSDNSELRIYTTTIVATNRFYTLMHDPQYRCAIAWQNTGYNQPPHPGFNIGPDMYPTPLPPISDAKLIWRGATANNVWDTAAMNWLSNNVWTGNIPATTFQTGDSVLFDISGTNNVAVNIPNSLAAGDVTVFSPTDYTFTGAGSLTGTMGLLKAGQGKLTINTTNTFSGKTTVSGGALFVNGTLDGSAVTVERRGTPEGPAQIGGRGRLGAGLTIQHGCVLTVGENANVAGPLTISNIFSEQGEVLNQFNLSTDPTGVTRTNDRVDVIGDLVLTGTNIIEVNQFDSALGDGVYSLITYSGTLTGGLTNLTLTGTFIQPVMLTNPPGVIGLLAIVPSGTPTPPDGLVATALGAFQINLHWTDNSADENAFLIERSTNNVNFDQIAVNSTDDTNYADIGLLADQTYYYRVRATNLAGASPFSSIASATTAPTPPMLTWKGDGTANDWDVATTANWLDDTNVTFYADTAFVTFNNTGSNSPSIKLATLLFPGSLAVTGTKNYTFTGNGGIGGVNPIVKSGSSTLTLGTTNTFSGGIIISNGSVVLSGSGGGGFTANAYVPGSGSIILRGGRFALYGVGLSDNTSSFGTFTNDIVVATGQTGTLATGPRQTLASKVTGAGTLTLTVDYVRGDVGGDWTSFTGNLNVTPTTGTPPSSTMDDFRVLTTGGFPNAKINLSSNVFMYSRASAGSVIPIGAFSAVRGAIVSANGGSGAGSQNAVTWRVGGLNTDATNAALIQTATSLIKEGNGKWTLTGTNTYSGTTTVNAGTLLINGDQSAANGNVVVNANGTLGGNGIIGGNTTVAGTLSPGLSIGKLTFNGNLTFTSSGAAIFELTKTPLTNDVARVLGTVTYGGTLDVENISPDLLVAGNNFKLFDAANYNGAFTSFSLPDLSDGLDWSTNKLTTDGRIWVVKTTPPVIANTISSGGNLILHGNAGTPNWDYFVLASTNLALPLAQWDCIATNQFDAFGNFSITNGINLNSPGRFYLIQAP